jgi:acyl dehydratase
MVREKELDKKKKMDLPVGTSTIAPVLPGDIITSGGTVIVMRFHGPGKDFVVFEIFAQNQNGEKVAVGETEIILP